MPTEKKPRLFYLDFIRAVALVCILVIHFNATVTGYFTYPSRLFGSVLPFGIYLGDFGSSLFFIVSGAALAYTAHTPLQPLAFYKKRAKAVYPMFWLAWAICFSLRFVRAPGYYAGAKTWTLILTALGLDNFAVAAGWVSQDFACVGEWFLGSILFLYLLFPLLHWGLRRNAVLCAVAVACVFMPLHFSGLDARLVAIHVPEFLFGMAFVSFSAKRQWLALGGSAGALALYALLPGSLFADTKVLCALFAATAFVLLAKLSVPLGRLHPLTRVCSALSKYSYAVFLLHHVIILRLVQNFDLANLTRRDSALLFGVYLLATAAAAKTLYWLDARLRRGLLAATNN